MEQRGRSRLIDYTAWNLPWRARYNLSNTLTWDYDHSHARMVERSNVHGTTFFAPGFELVIPTESTHANPKTIERTYIPTPEGMIGVLTRTNVGNNNSIETTSNTTDYWHKDHLGSLVATTNEVGAITQRFSFDPWGKRICLTAAGTTSTCSSNGSTGTEERGFTGHEMLDELGLIHMNGRLYDPEIGRFLQADPVIQNPLDGQNYNRYSYVGNNPLSYTDPSGFSRWTKWRRPILGLVAAIVVPWAAAEFFLANASSYGALAVLDEASSAAFLTSSGQAVANVAGGMAAGGVSGGNIQSAVIGAVTAGLQFGVGQALGHATPSLFGAQAGLAAQKAIAHAAIGCASAAASGGSCKAGAAAAGFSSLAGGSIPGANNILGRAAIGAVASKLAGGKAEQGALLAVMEYLFNEVAASFDKRTGILSMVDLDSGKTTTAKAFSGASGYMPIDDGTYDVLSFRDSKTRFRLEAQDSIYGDDVVEWSGRSQYRRHHRGMGVNWGCVSAESDVVDWPKIYSTIAGTSTTTANVFSKSASSSVMTMEPLTKYGTLQVFSSPVPINVNSRGRN